MDEIVHCGIINYDYTEMRNKNIKEVYDNLANEIINTIKDKTKDFVRWILQTDHYPFGYDCPITIYFDGKNYFVYDIDWCLFDRFYPEDNAFCFLDNKIKAKIYSFEVEHYNGQKDVNNIEFGTTTYNVDPFDFCEFLKGYYKEDEYGYFSYSETFEEIILEHCHNDEIDLGCAYFSMEIIGEQK